MGRRRLILGGTVAALAATVSLLGGVFSDSDPEAPAAAIPARVSADLALSGFSTGNTAQLIRDLQGKLRGGSRDARSHALLGLAYQQRARETGDPSFYPRAAGVLRRALALAPRSPLATSGLASLALSQHRFHDALALSRRAQKLAPGAAGNYGLVGDALVELGRYEEAFRAFDRMSALKPNLASYARVSYGRELLGRQEGAIRAMNLAVHARVPPGASCIPRLRLRPGRTSTRGGGQRSPWTRTRAGPPGRRSGPAAGVRDHARRPLPGDRPQDARPRAVRPRRRDRAPAAGERRADRSRERALQGRSRNRPSPGSRRGPQRAS